MLAPARRCLLVVCFALSAGACAFGEVGSPGRADTGSGTDALPHVDAPAETGADARVDARDAGGTDPGRTDARDDAAHPDGVTDGSHETGPDGAREAGSEPPVAVEAGPEAGPDAGPEAGPEAAADVIVEAGPDATADSALVADATVDAPAETGVDAAAEAGTGNALTCAAAIDVTGRTLSGQLFSDAVTTAPSGTNCGPSSGAVKFYSVDIPSGWRARVVITPVGNSVLARSLADCAATTCIGYAYGSPSVPADFTLTNNAPTTGTVRVAVASQTGSTGGSFTITTTLSPWFAVSTLTAACEDLSSGAENLPDAVGDDQTTLTLSLPFAFRYFGQSATHYVVSSNGFLVLFPTATGSLDSASPFSGGLPSALSPNGIVAPFWDDLYPPSGTPASAIQRKVVGTAPDRVLVIGWNAWHPITWNGSQTFQVKLFEGTNAIEFHYCSMTGTTGSIARITGSGATLGIESMDGTQAVLIAYDRANAATTGTGFRITPGT